MWFSPKSKIERYFKHNPDVKLVVVAGSFGRRSAIQAIGSVLGQTFTVGVGVNHEEALDVVIMDFNSSTEFPDVRADYVIIPSCRTEAEAQKYFELANKARNVFVNYNDVPQEYAKYLKNPNVITYGDDLPANYYFEEIEYDVTGWRGAFVTQEGERIPAYVRLLGEHNLRPVTMAVALGRLLHMPQQNIIEGVESIRPLPGHLAPGRGINGAIVIDDSADTSSTSVNLSLRAIYMLDAPSRILVLGKPDYEIKIDRSLVSQVLIMDSRARGQSPNDGFFYFFQTEVDLLAHLAKRMEPDGIVLLEYPLPGIISEYMLK
jgi:hypothetical protein